MIKSGQQLVLLELLRNSPLFAKLYVDALEPLVLQAHRIHFEKNSFLNIDSGESRNFHVIEQGRVSLASTTFEGDVFVIDILDRGGIFGIANLYEEDLQSHVVAEAVDNSMLWRIPINALNEMMGQDTQVMRNLLRMNLNTRAYRDLELEHRTLQSASQRISCFLLAQCAGLDQFPVTISLPYDKKNIAAKLGIRQETFSRALQTIKMKTGTQVVGSKLIVEDIDQLRSYTCRNCSRDFPECQSFPVNRIY